MSRPETDPRTGPSLEVITFGCRLNAYESQLIRDRARDAGLERAVVINTCAVTAEAERQARQAIRRARRNRPGVPLIVTGCAAQIDPQGFAAMPEVDRVIGNDAKLTAEAFRPDRTEPMLVNDLRIARETARRFIEDEADPVPTRTIGTPIGVLGGRARAVVQVQNGCDHRCTFCIIPYGRGNSRSIPIGEIVRQVRLLVESGHREVVLTGVDLTAYGADLPGRPTLGQMTRRLLAQVPALPRLRLSSIDPAEVDADLMRLIAEEPRLMPHLHISLQAGDDMVLKRMKRRHSRQQALDFCRIARDLRPGMAFGADIIAGFPTEDDAMFANSLAFVAEADLTWLHVFPYSPRPGTPAERMPQVPRSVRKERAARLRAAGEVNVARLLADRIGDCDQILIEQVEDGVGRGHCPRFAPVRVVVREGVTAGAILPIRFTATAAGFLVGDPVEQPAAA